HKILSSLAIVRGFFVMESRMAVKNWSTVADDNAFVDGINWQEGQFPSTVNNSAREMMAQIRADVALKEKRPVNIADEFGADGSSISNDNTQAFKDWRDFVHSQRLGSGSGANENSVAGLKMDIP